MECVYARIGARCLKNKRFLSQKCMKQEKRNLFFSFSFLNPIQPTCTQSEHISYFSRYYEHSFRFIPAYCSRNYQKNLRIMRNICRNLLHFWIIYFRVCYAAKLTQNEKQWIINAVSCTCEWVRESATYVQRKARKRNVQKFVHHFSSSFVQQIIATAIKNSHLNFSYSTPIWELSTRDSREWQRRRWTKISKRVCNSMYSDRESPWKNSFVPTRTRRKAEIERERRSNRGQTKFNSTLYVYHLSLSNL